MASGDVTNGERFISTQETAFSISVSGDIPNLDHVMRNVDTKVFKESVPEISVNQGSIS